VLFSFPSTLFLHPVTAIDLSRTFLIEDYTRFCFALADHDSAILCGGGGGGALSFCDQPSANDTGIEKQALVTPLMSRFALQA